MLVNDSFIMAKDIGKIPITSSLSLFLCSLGIFTLLFINNVIIFLNFYVIFAFSSTQDSMTMKVISVGHESLGLYQLSTTPLPLWLTVRSNAYKFTLILII